MSKKTLLIIAGYLLMLITIYIQDRQIDSLKLDRDRYKVNAETLMERSETFRVRDSLSAARVGVLELSVKELEKYRADDAALIKELTGKNRDLDRINKAQASTIITLRDIPRDTVVIIDSIPIPAKKVHCGDEWYAFDGILTADDFHGTMASRDELLLTETVKYKKILFWKTKKVKDREMVAVSRNPHTTITKVEHIIIDK